MVAILAVTATMLVSVACGAGGDDDRAITVFAAASLSDAFAEMADAFEEADSDVQVRLNFAGSSSLREQILQGAPADVFASANEANMDALVEDGSVTAPRTFATNRLQIVVPAGNPGGIDDLGDLADGDLLVGLCAVEVPCGDFSRQAFALAGVTPSPDTEEPDVRALLTKVEEGELDAAVVYRTDVIAAGDRVEGIEIPSTQNVVATYPIAGVVASDRGTDADRFVEFVLGPVGQSILADAGFGPP